MKTKILNFNLKYDFIQNITKIVKFVIISNNTNKLN